MTKQTIEWLNKKKNLEPSERLALELSKKGFNTDAAIDYFNRLRLNKSQTAFRQRQLKKMIWLAFAGLLLLVFCLKLKIQPTVVTPPYTATFRPVDWRLTNSSGLNVQMQSKLKSKEIQLYIRPSKTSTNAYLNIELASPPNTNAYDSLTLRHKAYGDIQLSVQLLSMDKKNRLRSELIRPNKEYQEDVLSMKTWRHETRINGKWQPSPRSNWPLATLKIAVSPTGKLLDEGGVYAISELDLK